MQTTIKMLRTIGLVILMSVCVNTLTHAQSPADDPGIGGVGSPSVGTGSDGGPVVPFDGGMSLMLVVSGVVYGARKIRELNTD